MEDPLEPYYSRIPSDDLDRPIDYNNNGVLRDLGKIADGMGDWKGNVADALDLKDPDISQIERKEPNNLNLQKREALKLWRERRGASRCTPKILIQTFAKSGLFGYVDVVCAVLGSPNALPQQHIHNKRPSESPNSKDSSQASRAIAADFSEVFSKSMNRDQLREWLLHKLGKDHEENIDKLYEQKVGGKTFLKLTEANLKTDFDITHFGSRQEILELVEELKAEQQPGQGHEAPHHSTSQAHRDEKMESVAEEQGNMESNGQRHNQPKEKGNVVKKPRCSFTGRPGQMLSSAPKKDGAKPAALPEDVCLWGKPELSVKIINPDLLKKWNRASTSTREITPDQIIEWANKWQRKLALNYEVYVPKFRLAGRSADVIIELNEYGNNSSLCGKDTRYPNGATMWLDLSPNATGDDDGYKEHVVVHEFGHTLGLGHEHQRSDFCMLISRFLNTSMMIKDLGSDCYDRWKEDVKLAISDASDYDCDSIMHYYFKKEWLTDGYDELDKIERDFPKYLTKPQRNALIGVHRRADDRYPTNPSKTDLEFLNEEYRKKFGGPPQKKVNVVADFDEPESGPPQKKKAVPVFDDATGYDGLDKVKHHYLNHFKWKTQHGREEMVKIYESSAVKWEEIANSLVLGRKIGIIECDQQTSSDRIKAVFREWLDNAGQLPKHKDYPLTWKGLVQLLKDSGLGTFASEVEEALWSPCNEVRGNL